MTPTWDDLAASTNATQADRNLLISIIAPDFDTLMNINLGNAFTYEIMLIAAHRQSAAEKALADGAAEEREKIVAWLYDEQREYPRTEYSGFAAMIAELISAKEHLK